MDQLAPTMNRIKVLLADDHRIVADGLRTILETDYDLIGIAKNGRELVDLALLLKPDVVVADISMASMRWTCFSAWIVGPSLFF